MRYKPFITDISIDKDIVQPGETFNIGLSIKMEEVVEESAMLIGMTANPDTLTTKPTSETFAAFNTGPTATRGESRIRYMRDFGKKRTDGATDITMPGTGKWAVMPEDCIPHQSWKGPKEQLIPFMDALNRPCYLTRRHEPMGDVTPDVLRAENNWVADVIDGHPNGHFVIAHGPVVTRYWLMQKAGTMPEDWAYDRMGIYGVDCYNDYTGTPTRYLAPDEMFAGLDRVQTAFPDVDLIIPEYGKARIAADADGSQRAASMQADIDFLKARSKKPVAIGWWNIGGDFITGLEPEQTVWRNILAGQ